MTPKEIVPSKSSEVALSTGLVDHEYDVHPLEGLRDLAASIERQAGEVIAIYAYNRNNGVQILDMPPDFETMDHKLLQLQEFVVRLRDIIDPDREVERKAKWLEEHRKLRGR